MLKEGKNIECLVCRNPIVIHQFQQLFSLEQPKLCSNCSSQMVESQKYTFPIRLYEDNLFMREFVRRLQQGDLVLQDVIIKKFHHVISKFEADLKVMIPIETKSQTLYPSMTILVERLNTDYCYKMTGKRVLMITDELSLIHPEKEQVIISIL